MLRELVGGERRKGDKVRRGARVDEERVLYAEQASELLLEGFSLRPEREPEIQRGTDRSFHFIWSENAPGIRNYGFPRNKCSTSGIVTRPLTGMHHIGILARKAENFGFQFVGCHE